MMNTQTIVATTALSCLAAVATMVPDTAWTTASAAATRVARSLQLTEEEYLPAETYDVLEDLSPGHHPVGDVLELVLRRAANRPGSVVRLWLQGNDMGSTTMVGPEIRSVPPAKRSARALKAHADHFVTTSRDLLLGALQPLIKPNPKRSRSPIAESLAKISLVPPEHSRRHIILLTDARECTPQFGDFECGTLPSPKTFLKKLHTARVLLPGCLARSTVTVAFMLVESVADRECPVTMERETKIRELWKVALEAAGATKVTFSIGLPNLEDESSTVTAKEA